MATGTPSKPPQQKPPPRLPDDRPADSKNNIIPSPPTPAAFEYFPPASPAFSYASNEPDIITVEPRIRPGTASPDSSARRSRRQQELNSVFFEELEDVPPQEAHERRMSIRRTSRVPLSGDTLGTSTAPSGSGSGLRTSTGPGDWREEQREWEKSAEAMMEGAVVDPARGSGGVGPEGSSGQEITETSPRSTRYIRSLPRAATGDSVATGNKSLSWQPGDETTTARHTQRGGVNRGSLLSGDPPPSNWRRFFSWVLTVKGFLITLYALNIVAWGAMLFFLLVNAAPAMCHPNCNDPNSSRRIWIEITCQIMNSLFCVTGFGLIPWRFRDLYLLLRYRLQGDVAAWEKLRCVHHKWDRWVGESCKVDLVVHLYCLNTYLQAGLSGLMWGMNRFNRPAAATGAVVAAACVAAIVAVWIELREGSKAKKAQRKGARSAAAAADGGESGIGPGNLDTRMSQLSRGTEAEAEDECEAKNKEAGLM